MDINSQWIYLFFETYHNHPVTDGMSPFYIIRFPFSNITMKFTIVTVSLNAADTIEKTILSVINQTYHDVEYIMIDGDSTDGTIDIINKYLSRISFFLSEPDNGLYDAMNKGIRHATGDFVLFLGADDAFYSDHVLQNVAAKMIDRNAIYYGNVIKLPSHKLYWGKFNKYKFGMGNICHQSIFYPKQVFNQDLFDTKYTVYADYVFNLRLYHTVRFVYIDEVIAYFDVRGISSRSVDTNFKNDKYKLIIDNLGYVPLFCRGVFHGLVFLRDYFIRS